MYIAAIEEAGLKKKPDRPIGYLDGRTSEVKQQQQLLMLSAAPSLTSRQRRGFREKKKQPDRALSEIKKEKKGKTKFSPRGRR